MNEKEVTSLGVAQPGPILPILEVDQNNPTVERAKSQDILTAAKGGGISFAGRIFEYVVRFAFGILIARVIGVEQFGLYALATTVSLIASNMAMLGLQVGMVRFLPPAIREKDEQSIWGIIQVCVGLPALFSLFLAAGLFLLANPVAALLFHSARMVPLLRIVSFLVPLDTLASMAYLITISFKQPKYGVIARDIIAPLLKLVSAAGFLAVGLSTEGVLVSQIIASLAALTVLLYYANSLFSFIRAPAPELARSYSKQLLRYSIPVQLGWMVNILQSTLSTIVLGFLGLPSGVGIYIAASRFSLIGYMFYQSIGHISTPIVADLHSRDEKPQMKAYYQTTTRWMVLFNLPVFLTSVLFARPLLLIFGDDFATGTASMIILAVGTLVYTCTGVGANILDMTDHPRVNAVNSVIMVFISILLNAILVPQWGVVGAAAATSLSTVLVNMVCLMEVWILLGMQPYDKSFIKPVVAGLTAALVTILLKYFMDLSILMQLIAGGGALWIVYASALYLLKLSPDDQIVLGRFLSRLQSKRSKPQDVPQC